MSENNPPIKQLLELTIAQLKLSQLESQAPVDTLTTHFTELANLAEALLDGSKRLAIADQSAASKNIQAAASKNLDSVKPIEVSERLLVGKLEASNNANDSTRSKTNDDIESIQADLVKRIRDSIVAFQFYDRLSQKLDHVITQLEKASSMISSDNTLHEAEWQSLLTLLASTYSMENEKRVLEAIIRGEKIDINQLRDSESAQRSNESDIEIF